MEPHECYMKEQIESIGNDVRDIKKALLGDDYMEEGIIKKMIKLEQQQLENNTIIRELKRLRKEDSEKLRLSNANIEILQKAEKVISKKMWMIYGAATLLLFLLQVGISFVLKMV